MTVKQLYFFFVVAKKTIFMDLDSCFQCFISRNNAFFGFSNFASSINAFFALLNIIRGEDYETPVNNKRI